MRLIRSNKYIRRLTAGLSACLISASLMHVDAYAINNIDIALCHVIINKGNNNIWNIQI